MTIFPYGQLVMLLAHSLLAWPQGMSCNSLRCAWQLIPYSKFAGAAA